jgi:GxxExxY protein
MEDEELTYRIRGCVYEVFRVLGAGFLEQVYHQALLHELTLQGLNTESQRNLDIHYKGRPVGQYVADIVVENRVVVELKAVQSLTKAHEAQLLNYLKGTGIRVGLLVNFVHPKAEVRRFVL